MEMKKKKIYLLASSVGLLGLLAGCSVGHTQNTRNDNDGIKNTKVKLDSNTPNLSKISDKTITVMAFEETTGYRDDKLSDLADSAYRYIYKTNYQGGKPNQKLSDAKYEKILGTNYIYSDYTGKKLSPSDVKVWVKRNGDKVTISVKKHDDPYDDDGLEVNTYSLAKLVDKYYSTKKQRARIDKYTKNLKNSPKEFDPKPKDITKINDKVVAVMVFGASHYGVVDSLDYGRGSYGSHYPKGNSEIRGSKYIRKSGEPVWFKRNGDQIAITTLSVGYDYDAEDATFTTKNYSLKDLVKKYYNSQRQREKINEIADRLKSE